MSAKSLIIWTAAAFFGLSAAMMLAPREAPIASLADGLGPKVATETL